MKRVLVLDDMDLGIAFGKWLKYEFKLAAEVYDNPEYPVMQVKSVAGARAMLFLSSDYSKTETWVDDENAFTYILIDNDLGMFDPTPGVRLLDWIEEMVAIKRMRPSIADKLVANSANPPARDTMHVIINRIKEMR